MALLASLEIFDEVGIDSLVAKQWKLTAYLELLIQLKLKNQVTIITPHSPAERGCQLSLLFSEGVDVKILEDKLANEGVVVDTRGRVIRVAPVPLYNSFSDVFQFVDILSKILASSSKL